MAVSAATAAANVTPTVGPSARHQIASAATAATSAASSSQNHHRYATSSGVPGGIHARASKNGGG
jgi:hypothetical protein